LASGDRNTSDLIGNAQLDGRRLHRRAPCSMSSDLAPKIRVGLEEFANVRQQFESLLSIPPDADPGVIETSAACAMLHSFYTEIEKILKIIAREWDNSMPASESWHRDLLFKCPGRLPDVPLCFQRMCWEH
jgi:hypothetical protein